MVLNPDERKVRRPLTCRIFRQASSHRRLRAGQLSGGAGPAALTSTGGPTPVMQPGIRDFLDRLDSWLPAALRRQPGNVL